jgi:hypothetical protein
MFVLRFVLTVGVVCGFLQGSGVSPSWNTQPSTHIVSFDSALKDVYCAESPHVERNTTTCIVFFTGGSSAMTPNIYSRFLSTIVDRNLSVCIPSFFYPNIDLLISSLKREFKEVVVAGHSSGCTVALNACGRNRVEKVILMDPVNTRFNDTTRKFDIPRVGSILFLNAMKSYHTTFDPFGLPFIPVGIMRLSFLRITPDILDIGSGCNFTHIEYPNHGHCDILNPGWSNLMHYTRIAVGNRIRTMEMFKTYHTDIANTWCDFIGRL